MKDSILAGATESAPVQSSNNKPCGSAKGPKGATSKYATVAFSNTDRAKTAFARMTPGERNLQDDTPTKTKRED